MNKKTLHLIILLLAVPFMMLAQSYTSLWKQYEQAVEKDLPQTQAELLERIAGKAEGEKAYGQLLKAELTQIAVQTSVSPDSLRPLVARLAAKERVATDEVLQAVYAAALYRLAKQPQLADDSIAQKADEYRARAMSHPQKLADTPDKDFAPAVVKGANAAIFANNMLSVVGFEVEDYHTLYYYYEQNGNRRAACLTALRYLLQNRPTDDGRELKKSYFIMRLDSLMNIYRDLDVAGEAAVERYRAMELCSDVTVENKIEYIHYALANWGRWQRAGELRNAEKELTAPSFEAKLKSDVMRPGCPQMLYLNELRNLSSLQLKVYRLKVDGTCLLDPNQTEDYAKLKSLAKPLASHARNRSCLVGAPWKTYEDSIEIAPLERGVYMIELLTAPATQTWRALVYVSDVYVISQSLPQNKQRLNVVSATTGLPMAGAHVRLTAADRMGNTQKCQELTADENGELTVSITDRQRQNRVYAYTDNDNAFKESQVSHFFSYIPRTQATESIRLFTDRSLYRPGQTVRVAAIVSCVTNATDGQAVAGKTVKAVLRDANRKVIAEKNITTDTYGTCWADFVLPKSSLNGRWSVSVNNNYSYFSVEAYKRPTFRVEFPQINEKYQDGDTLVVKATASSYAGVPVQGAQVSYRVTRRPAFWWRSWAFDNANGISSEARKNKQVWKAETTTGADGRFEVVIPLILSNAGGNNNHLPLFYQFVVEADVTDMTGESHHAELSVPLGTKPTAFSCNLPQKVLTDSVKQIVFTLRNAAGVELTAPVDYYFDQAEQMLHATTGTAATMPEALSSGIHRLVAICEGDTLSMNFTAFSLSDTKPAADCREWFYASSREFHADGTPVTVQAGSSDSLVYALYTVISGDRLMEQGRVLLTDSIINRKFTYDASYGDGILLSYAWVKDGQLHHWNTNLTRPVPPHKLKMEWESFRDRLQPGQQEEWTLRVTNTDGQAVQAQLLATLYDQSLDAIKTHGWSPFLALRQVPYPSLFIMGSSKRTLYGSGIQLWKAMNFKTLDLSRIDESLLQPLSYSFYVPGVQTRYSKQMMKVRGTMAVQDMASSKVFFALNEMESATAAGQVYDTMQSPVAREAKQVGTAEHSQERNKEADNVSMRENFQETAFFNPNILTDADGRASIRFTLPESVTSWRFLALAHTTDVSSGLIEAVATARKDLMIQPNLPRFVRQGDKTQIEAKVTNMTAKDIKAKARIELLDPETAECIWQKETAVLLPADTTSVVSFAWNVAEQTQALLICRMSISGGGCSDGEQHYLPVLPATERVTVTRPFTLNGVGEKTIQVDHLFPKNTSDRKLTIEYTANPAWLSIQALPSLTQPKDNDALSLTAAYYAHAVASSVLQANPEARKAFELWQNEEEQLSLTSALRKNQELKDILLNETPWVADADREDEQKQRLADFFDANIIPQRQQANLDALAKLQQADGSFSWMPGMKGNIYITTEVAMMLARIEQLPDAAQKILSHAMTYLDAETVKMTDNMRKHEAKGEEQHFPSRHALQWLWLHAAGLSGNHVKTKASADYLLQLMKKDIRRQSIYEKALAAVILDRMGEKQKAAEYAESIRQYTVCQEEMGRYFDTPKAEYSWCDYRIPTQTAAIEALMLTAASSQANTIAEMQRWLLQEKRTQAWDHPIASVNAVAALLKDKKLVVDLQGKATFSLDGKPLTMPQATAAIGYVKTAAEPGKAHTFRMEKTSEGMAWGALYAQYTQKSSEVEDNGSGLSLKREVIILNDEKQQTLSDQQATASVKKNELKVGQRVKVRITVTAHRDLDFVQISDRRPACMEPVNQLSGYHNGAYCSNKNSETCYYFDRMAKGTHVVETEYYIDRSGTYQSGSCSVQCAYAPEYKAMAGGGSALVIKPIK